ncbi:MAG TPA: FkbM family methyltransferase [Anaerolineales bacterium]|nr:FkbM family methyltransferase [Anaerolineales bacterium]
MRFQFVQNIIDIARGKTLHKKISYAQSGEDVIIYNYIQLFKLKNFSWIDIGAHHPEHLSNTKLFYDNGYHGINIDGDPSLMKEFYKKRNKDTNLNVLVSDKIGAQTFFILDPPVLNTLSEEDAIRYERLGYKIKGKITVNTLTINDVLERYTAGVFPDLLSIDAEGYDFEIIKMINWEKSVPKIICVEIGEHTPFMKDNFRFMKDHAITNYLFEKGYFISAYTYNNTIFVSNTLISDK